MQGEIAFMRRPRIRRIPVKKSKATENLQNTSVRSAGIEISDTTESVQESAQSHATQRVYSGHRGTAFGAQLS